MGCCVSSRNRRNDGAASAHSHPSSSPHSVQSNHKSQAVGDDKILKKKDKQHADNHKSNNNNIDPSNHRAWQTVMSTGSPISVLHITTNDAGEQMLAQEGETPLQFGFAASPLISVDQAVCATGTGGAVDSGMDYPASQVRDSISLASGGALVHDDETRRRGGPLGSADGSSPRNPDDPLVLVEYVDSQDDLDSHAS